MLVLIVIMLFMWLYVKTIEIPKYQLKMVLIIK